MHVPTCTMHKPPKCNNSDVYAVHASNYGLVTGANFGKNIESPSIITEIQVNNFQAI